MSRVVLARHALALATAGLLLGASAAHAGQAPFEPRSGQPGKDVVWVPTPDALVETMLDMAEVTSRDVVMDLGSGDGRNVIAAARRGARAIGVEFNPDMVALSRRRAVAAGVASRATFVEGDMFEADVSKATVLALFLLPSNLEKLKDKFFALRPGTRIVLNTFGIAGWDADATQTIDGECSSWCTAMLLVVPAKVAGTWRLDGRDLVLEQSYQRLTGTLATSGAASAVKEGRLLGDAISFNVDTARYTGRVHGDVMDGTVTIGVETRQWRATRTPR